jgi:hypothetical protein
MVEYKDYHCVLMFNLYKKMCLRIFMWSFYYMFKLYKLFRDNLEMEMYLFKDQIQASWKKNVIFNNISVISWRSVLFVEDNNESREYIQKHLNHYN